MRVRRVAALLLVGVAACATAVAVAYRVAYTNWPWQGPPQRVSWCDRVYERTDVQEPRDALGGVDLVAVFRAPPLVGDEAYVTTREAADERASDRCPSGLYLRVDDSRYRSYQLLGGQ